MLNIEAKVALTHHSVVASKVPYSLLAQCLLLSIQKIINKKSIARSQNG